VFCEKPMATDAPGVRSVFESARAATEKNLSLVAGFCWRRDVPRREFYKRIHDGAIGDIRAIYATYYTGPVKPMPPASERPAGVGKIPGWQAPNITGKETWRYHETGPKTDMYQNEHDELFASIRSGRPINDGQWMTQSTLMGLMGRMAAYTGAEVTWEQVLNSQEKLVPDQLDWKMSLEIAPMAVPGVTKVA